MCPSMRQVPFNEVKLSTLRAALNYFTVCSGRRVRQWWCEIRSTSRPLRRREHKSSISYATSDSIIFRLTCDPTSCQTLSSSPFMSDVNRWCQWNQKVSYFIDEHQISCRLCVSRIRCCEHFSCDVWKFFGKCFGFIAARESVFIYFFGVEGWCEAQWCRSIKTSRDVHEANLITKKRKTFVVFYSFRELEFKCRAKSL